MRKRHYTGAGLLVALVAAGLLTIAAVSARAVAVSAGTLTGIEGDFTFGTAPIVLFDAGGDNVVNMVLDLGSVTNVDAILNVNRLGTDSNSNAKKANILVAPDETAGGFNPSLASSFTVPVFSGSFTPSANTAGTVQMADIVNVTRRYFLIDYTENFWAGSISGTVPGNTDRVFISDLQIVIVPEPATMGLLAIGGLLLWRRLKK